MKTLNITIINQVMGIYYGGGENFTVNIAKALKKRGHNIKLIIGKSSKKITPLPKEVNTFRMSRYNWNFNEIMYSIGKYLNNKEVKKSRRNRR